MEKISIVIGASGGLGNELIKKYIENNYYVYAVYNNHKVSIKNKNLETFKYNLISETNYLDLYNKIKENVNKNTQVSIVYAPGIYYKENIEDYDENKLIENIKINVSGFLNIYKKIYLFLQKAKITNVILIGSNLLKRKNTGSLYYVLSKGMQTQLIKQCAYEHGKYNILFNQLSPGIFLSNMNCNISKKKIQDIEKNIPIKRIGTSKEIANFIYEFTDKNTLINGEEIIMDGGNTIGY